jgi:hypothetical protein
MGEKFVLNSPVILEDLMKDVEGVLIQETERRALCAKCFEGITVDFLKVSYLPISRRYGIVFSGRWPFFSL